jgi:hypothetical protein
MTAEIAAQVAKKPPNEVVSWYRLLRQYGCLKLRHLAAEACFLGHRRPPVVETARAGLRPGY